MIFERAGRRQSKRHNRDRSPLHRSVMHAAIALIPLALVIWSLVRIFGPDDPSPSDLVADPGVSHVHGLGVNPALDLYGFAVDPGDARRLVSAAPGGVRRSTDGGSTWLEPSGPPITAISWAPVGTVWGVEASGAVHRSDDDGVSWTLAGRLPGQPQALLATDDGLWAAAHGDDGLTGIYRSTDDGSTWDLRYQDEDQ